VIWREFKEASPGMAQIGLSHFQRTGLALLGTVRRDGSPRISPIEPYFVQEHLVLGMMRSQKALDLLREPRYVLHNTVSDRNGSEGIFTIRGKAIRVGDHTLRELYIQTWSEGWKSQPLDGFPNYLFSLDIETATSIGWDTERGEMTIRQWSPSLGLTITKRKYP
jgi:hypothetical protein